jgi:hypothetical protein
MRWRIFLLGLAGLCGACGNKKETSADEPERKAPPPASAAATAAAPVTLLGAVREGATLAGTVDVKRLRDAGWLASIRSMPVPELKTQIEELQKKCGTDPFAVVDQVAFSAGGKGEMLVVAKLGVPEDKAIACLRGVTGRAEEAKLGERPVLRIGSTVVVAQSGHLVAGSEEWVKVFLDGVNAGELAADLAPLEGSILQIAGTPGGDARKGKGSITTSATKLAIDAELTMASAEAATELAAKAKSMREELAKQLATSPDLVAENIQMPELAVTVAGSQVVMHAEIAGDATKQVAVVGVFSALGVYATRRYLALSKTAEVKANLGAIARSLVAAAERETQKQGVAFDHVFPPTAPPIPKEVPKGTKYQSSDADWEHPSWSAVKFALTTPQYFSYSFETSPDGKKCTVIGRGDLDGDGVESKFSIDLGIDASGSVKRAPEMRVENELE